MTDDLVKRLREYGHVGTVLEAADRIEALTEQLEAARADAKEAEAYAEELERNLKEAVRALQIARVHVANNECGWGVSRTAARFDLGVIDHIMEKIGASYD